MVQSTLASTSARLKEELMGTTITPDVVRSVAKEVFPGFTDQHIGVDYPSVDTDWCVEISFSTGSAILYISCEVGNGLVTARGGRLVDVDPTHLSNEADLRCFLEACHDSFAKNLEAMLAIALGPVRVLPVDEALDGLPLFGAGSWYGPDHTGGQHVGDLFQDYASRVASRRAAAKPVGS